MKITITIIKADEGSDNEESEEKHEDDFIEFNIPDRFFENITISSPSPAQSPPKEEDGAEVKKKGRGRPAKKYFLFTFILSFSFKQNISWPKVYKISTFSRF